MHKNTSPFLYNKEKQKNITSDVLTKYDSKIYNKTTKHQTSDEITKIMKVFK